MGYNWSVLHCDCQIKWWLALDLKPLEIILQFRFYYKSASADPYITLYQTYLSLLIPVFKRFQVWVPRLINSHACFWWNYTEGAIVIMIIKASLEFLLCTSPYIALKNRFQYLLLYVRLIQRVSGQISIWIYIRLKHKKPVLFPLYLHQPERCLLWRNQIKNESSKPRISNPENLDTALLILTKVIVITHPFNYQSYLFLSLNNNNTTTITATKSYTLKCKWQEMCLPKHRSVMKK